MDIFCFHNKEIGKQGVLLAEEEARDAAKYSEMKGEAHNTLPSSKYKWS